MGYIYKITNLINQKKYIGQTTQTIEKRWKEHLYRNENTICNYSLYNAFKKYGIQNFSIEQVEECSNDLLNQREKFWIQYYDSFNNGYNMTIGGEGIQIINPEDVKKLWEDGFCVRDISKQLDHDRGTVSRIVKGFGYGTSEEILQRGIQKSSQAKEKEVYVYSFSQLVYHFISVKEAASYFNIAERTIRKRCTENFFVNYLLFSYVPLTVEQRVEIFRQKGKTPIGQYSLEGIFLNAYGSFAEATSKTGINNISKAIKEQSQAGGFQWREYDILEKDINPYSPKRSKKVMQYSLSGEYIKTFNSLTEAAREVGLSGTSGITIACQNFDKTAKGFRWKYYEESNE